MSTISQTEQAGGAETASMQLPLRAEEVERTTWPLESAYMLPPAAFTEQAVLDWELENVFTGWICLGHASAVEEQGSYLMRTIGSTSLFATRGEDGRVRAFLNACRHRGARIVTETEGQVRRRFQCPYHAWSYDLEGRLVAAPHMDEVDDFDRACWGLIEVRSAIVGGLLLVDLGGVAADPDEHVGELTSFLDRYRAAELRRASGTVYEVSANWKAIAENYNECLHCPGVHPELNALSDYRSGEAMVGEGNWCGGSMTLNEQADTMGKGGGRAGSRPAIDGLTDQDLRSVYYFALFPNALVSLHPDYLMLHTLWPREPGLTEVTCEWFFEPSTIARDDFDPSDAVEFWDLVNRQDWEVCELTQSGIGARGYTAGRYSSHEGDVHAFDAMVAERYLRALGAANGADRGVYARARVG
jgi:Rieske 2Fe-2S family protein